MPWTVTYDPESGFVVSVYKGKLTGDDLKAEEEQSLALAIEKGTHRFLVDLVDYEGAVAKIDIFDSPSRYEDKLTRPIFVAVVEPLSLEARKDAQFYETVCRNRGWNVKIFEKRDDAVTWLGKMKPC